MWKGFNTLACPGNTETSFPDRGGSVTVLTGDRVGKAFSLDNE